MIQVHHLNNSRSQRILWLLEELGTEYEIIQHTRDSETNLAPDSLLAVHPLGKSPLIVDDGEVIIESGAIVEYIVRKYGNGELATAYDSPDYPRYLQLLHYSEGSAMLPLMLNLYVGRLGDAGAPLQERIQQEMNNHLGYLDSQLEGRDFFMGAELSAVDVQLSFAAQVGRMMGGLEGKDNLNGYLDRIHARPAYLKAVEKGGPYPFGS